MTDRICLAPLRGVTDALFREAYSRWFSGVDRAVTPFLTTHRGPRIKPSQLAEVLPENNRRMPVVPQILSKTADHFLRLAGSVFHLGYDTVNWNLGCPYPMVARKGRGSGMLNRPEAIGTFLERVVPALDGHLSIKMRLGRFDAEEAESVLPILNRFELAEVIVHPRTGVQMYDGAPDLDAFERCLSMTHHRVVYNGDIVDCAFFRRLKARFPQVGEWMIGRGAVANPFLPAAIKGVRIDAGEALVRFKAFHDTLYEGYGRKLFGPAHLVGRMKGLWGYFHKAFKEGRRLRKKINKSRIAIQYEAAVSDFFQEDPQWTDAVLRDFSGRIGG
jgi:tRNA-dihydrouridine synthase